MTFETIETSKDDGRPVHLLQINYSVESWYYASAEVSIPHAGHTYTPLPMETGSSPSTSDATKASRVIKVPRDTPVGDLFRVRPPSEVVTVSIFEEHYQDNNFQTTWKGRITAVDWQRPWLHLHCESVYSSLKRIGLRRRNGVQCGHVLYETGTGKCNVDRAVFKVSGIVTLVAGASVNVSTIGAAPADFYAGGYAEWVSSETGSIERMMIVSSASGAVTLSGFPFGLPNGAVIDLFPGCDHFLATCNTKFGNGLNFGGTPFIPQKNPFDGTMIY